MKTALASFFLEHPLMARVVSAFLMMPVVLTVLVFGGWPLALLLGLALTRALYEWVRMARHHVRMSQLVSIMGCLYILASFFCFYYLRERYPDGLGLSLLLIFGIWASDSAAYFTGKTFKGPKLAPKISPNKTWSGLLGGMMGSGLTFLLYVFVVAGLVTALTGIDFGVMEGFPVWLVFLLGASLTVSGQAGDLLISMEKRKVGVKDTGGLIPGHGGILDRIDALLLACPIFLATLKIVGL